MAGKEKQMKNTRRNFIVLAVFLTGICLSVGSSVDVRGSMLGETGVLGENSEDISYIIDFMDYDGSFLDSKICTYGQKLEDIKIPERKEDEEYTYRFMGWEPELCDVVTESAAYFAVYERIPKDGSDPVITEVSSNSVEKTENEDKRTKSPGQIYAISYDVVPIPVETPAPVEDEVLDSLDIHVGKIRDISVPVIHVPGITIEGAAIEQADGTADEGSMNETATAQMGEPLETKTEDYNKKTVVPGNKPAENTKTKPPVQKKMKASDIPEEKEKISENPGNIKPSFSGPVHPVENRMPILLLVIGIIICSGIHKIVVFLPVIRYNKKSKTGHF